MTRIIYYYDAGEQKISTFCLLFIFSLFTTVKLFNGQFFANDIAIKQVNNFMMAVYRATFETLSFIMQIKLGLLSVVYFRPPCRPMSTEWHASRPVWIAGEWRYCRLAERCVDFCVARICIGLQMARCQSVRSSVCPSVCCTPVLYQDDYHHAVNDAQ